MPQSFQRQIDALDITILMTVIYFSLNTQGVDENTKGLGIIISTLACPSLFHKDLKFRRGDFPLFVTLYDFEVKILGFFQPELKLLLYHSCL